MKLSQRRAAHTLSEQASPKTQGYVQLQDQGAPRDDARASRKEVPAWADTSRSPCTRHLIELRTQRLQHRLAAAHRLQSSCAHMLLSWRSCLCELASETRCSLAPANNAFQHTALATALRPHHHDLGQVQRCNTHGAEDLLRCSKGRRGSRQTAGRRASSNVGHVTRQKGSSRKNQQGGTAPRNAVSTGTSPRYRTHPAQLNEIAPADRATRQTSHVTRQRHGSTPPHGGSPPSGHNSTVVRWESVQVRTVV